jgi:hypothetical protein
MRGGPRGLAPYWSRSRKSTDRPTLKYGLCGYCTMYKCPTRRVQGRVAEEEEVEENSLRLGMRDGWSTRRFARSASRDSRRP